MDKKYNLKDSGNRQVFATGAQRDRQIGKGRYDLTSPIPMKRVADIFEKGALKYSERNWEKGMPISRYIDSAMRHLDQYREGKRDEDHLGQAYWNLHAALHCEVMVQRKLWGPEMFDLPCYINEKDMDEDTQKWWKEMKNIKIPKIKKKKQTTNDMLKDLD